LLKSSESTQHKPRHAYNFNLADYDAINDFLCNHPFNKNFVEANSTDNVCFSDSVDDVWNKFISPLNSAFEAFVPGRRPAAVGCMNNKRNKHYPPHIRRDIKRKASFSKTYRLNPADVNLTVYKGQAAIVKKLILSMSDPENWKLLTCLTWVVFTSFSTIS